MFPSAQSKANLKSNPFPPLSSPLPPLSLSLSGPLLSSILSLDQKSQTQTLRSSSLDLRIFYAHQSTQNPNILSRGEYVEQDLPSQCPFKFKIHFKQVKRYRFTCHCTPPRTISPTNSSSFLNSWVTILG